jgi:hypothetical protein
MSSDQDTLWGRKQKIHERDYVRCGRSCRIPRRRERMWRKAEAVGCCSNCESRGRGRQRAKNIRCEYDSFAARWTASRNTNGTRSARRADSAPGMPSRELQGGRRRCSKAKKEP